MIDSLDKTNTINRESFVSAQVLSDKMQGFLSILSLFRNKFNKFNDTGVGMLDSYGI